MAGEVRRQTSGRVIATHVRVCASFRYRCSRVCRSTAHDRDDASGVIASLRTCSSSSCLRGGSLRRRSVQLRRQARRDTAQQQQLCRLRLSSVGWWQASRRVLDWSSISGRDGCRRFARSLCAVVVGIGSAVGVAERWRGAAIPRRPFEAISGSGSRNAESPDVPPARFCERLRRASRPCPSRTDDATRRRGGPSQRRSSAGRGTTHLQQKLHLQQLTQ